MSEEKTELIYKGVYDISAKGTNSDPKVIGKGMYIGTRISKREGVEYVFLFRDANGGMFTYRTPHFYSGGKDDLILHHWAYKSKIPEKEKSLAHKLLEGAGL